MFNDIKTDDDVTPREILTLVFAHAFASTGKYKDSETIMLDTVMLADNFLKEPK